ncbi:diguanylate cyclase [Pseudomonas sp. ABC1]|uniref:GGDEF domain-containing protein n=1 Tax=Pseudomonas sp. ABC1 TaxID=2748080 RepID=UPI0015C3284B|nr:diguanylate cyclase [Pseudomonas sp. ABC1]
MSLSSKSTTINFDTARLKSFGLPPYQHTRHTARNLDDLHSLLTQHLQTSLEVDRLLEYFFTDITSLIALDGLAYCHEETDLHLQLGSATGETCIFPLSHESEALGRLTLYQDRPFDAQKRLLLENLVDALRFPLRNALLYRSAVQASLKDPLTSTGNRTALQQSLQRETELARRYNQPLSLIMLDMDHFKKLNDEHGHDAGDQALKSVAKLLKAQLRNIDMVFRFGGEEFLLILSNTPVNAAALVGERIRLAIETTPLELRSATVRLSASLGCALYQPGESSDTLLQRADAALYRAKQGGRNQVRLAD